MTETPGDDTPTNQPPPGYWEQQAQPRQQGYGYPPYAPYGYAPRPHPEANKVLALGLVAVVGGMACFLPTFVAPFAWIIGNRVTREIDAADGQWGGRSEAQTGKILGIIGTCLLVLGLVLVIAYFVWIFTILAPAFDDSGPSNV